MAFRRSLVSNPSVTNRRSARAGRVPFHVCPDNSGVRLNLWLHAIPTTSHAALARWSTGKSACIWRRFLRATVEKGAARRLRFGEPFQRDLGRPASLAKICRFPSNRIEGYFNAVLFRQEGRIARRHERGTGCGGRRSVRREALFAGRLSVSEHSAQDERR